MKKLEWMKVFFSPFKRPKIKFYIGRIKYGVPYFYPRKWIKYKGKALEDEATRLWEINSQKNTIEYYKKQLTGMLHAVPNNIGFDFIPLGWKTKWDEVRFEYNPIWSFVIFGLQICIIFEPDNPDQYWESFLNYELNTDHNKNPIIRLFYCKQHYPQIWSVWKPNSEKQLVDYYPLIVKHKYKIYVS